MIPATVQNQKNYQNAREMQGEMQENCKRNAREMISSLPKTASTKGSFEEDATLKRLLSFTFSVLSPILRAPNWVNRISNPRNLPRDVDPSNYKEGIIAHFWKNKKDKRLLLGDSDVRLQFLSYPRHQSYIMFNIHFIFTSYRLLIGRSTSF